MVGMSPISFPWARIERDQLRIWFLSEIMVGAIIIGKTKRNKTVVKLFNNVVLVEEVGEVKGIRQIQLRLYPREEPRKLL